MKLFSFWRSLATFRVRIALNLKGLEPEVIQVDLLKGAQRTQAYRDVNPQMLLPALVDGEGPALHQSLAIIEYLDETHPQPRLLPADPRGRARVRALAMMVACDMHPFIVPRVRNFLEHELKLDEAQRLKWLRHWINEGLGALETHLARSGETGGFCHGDAPTLADLCLVSHAAGAQYYDCDVAPFPTVSRIVERCMAIDAFSRAHPLMQPDAPKSGAH
jgi:maleylacetoacetate isomerase